MRCHRPLLDDVEAAEGVVPFALAATTTAAGTGLMEGSSDGCRGRVTLLLMSAAGVDCADVSHIQPDERPWTGDATSSPPSLKTVTSADGSRAETWPLPP